MVVRIVPRRTDLLDDHLLLTGQFVVFEQRILQDIREDVRRQYHVVLEHAGEIPGVFDGGCGVEVTTDILDGLGNLEGRAAGGALEGHVLEQVRDTVLALALAARSGLDPHPQ